MDEWWSVKPPGAEDLSCELPEYQAFWQVKTLEKVIENFLSRCKPINLVIHYENLCANPEKCITQISDEFRLKRKPSDFTRLKASTSVKIPEDVWHRLEKLYYNQ
jgi:hypothetical protein